MNNATEFAARIGLGSELYKGLPLFHAEDLYNAFHKCPREFVESKKSRADFNSYMLEVYLILGAAAKQKYLDKGFNEKIYIDTMRDIALWAEVYNFETGNMGLADSEIDWLIPHMSAGIATLGRLQFKPNILDCEVIVPEGKVYKKGGAFVEVHIPRGGPLTRDETEKSFAAAKERYGSGVLYSCYSWMLSPALKEILQQDSNILRFGDMFYKTFIDSENSSAERYINYMTAKSGETTLSRGMRVLKAQGRKAGAACGWLVR